ncbi:hypothetical protein RSOLAG22IIIB_10042 [Rhizoctonia solani]|uniref:Jacalin-type lectin domain-containing protein n=1 Tax=Rhizoctonia solani TaxID=456999 RepID=A0A0K6G0L4_9AGAM|nr:hypothetical protein RSOLAG22IIIB_10042 [Rhizoctonia solani]
MNFEIVGDGKLPARREIPEEFDFSIKKSPVFGNESGEKFDEGAVWYPLREVKFALSDTGLGRYQSHYPGRSTAPVGQLPSTKSTGLKLNKEEHIVGFRAYLNNNMIEGVRVWTNDGGHKDFGKVQGATERGQDPEAFFVPPDHEVVNFFGHTNEDGQIHGLGVSYTRRLASLATKGPKSGPNDSSPELSMFLSQTYLDASTQHSWATNDMATITRKRDQASKDLAPIYANIDKHGDGAWIHVRDPKTGQEYYVSVGEAGTVWSYVADQPSTSGSEDTKNAVVSIGSYSATTNMLGISGYLWKNIPATEPAPVIALAFSSLVKPLIAEGIQWGIKKAASQLAEYLFAVGLEKLGILVPESVIPTGGLVIAGVIGVFVVFGILGLINVIFKKFWLIVNVYNFDLDRAWTSIKYHGDNAQVSNEEWRNKTIPTFKPVDPTVFPPSFSPPQPMESVVTSLCMTFDNINTTMQGLGVGVLLSQGNNQIGTALKYIVHYFSDNEINLEFINEHASTFGLEEWYNNGDWVRSQSKQVESGKYLITGYTPKLGGSENDDYYYDVCIGLPPPVVR